MFSHLCAWCCFLLSSWKEDHKQTLLDILSFSAVWHFHSILITSTAHLHSASSSSPDHLLLPVKLCLDRCCWAHLPLLLSINIWKISTDGCSHQRESHTFEANKYWTNTDKKNTGGELHHISDDLLSNARHKSYRPFQTQFAARLIHLHVHKWKRSKNCHPSRINTSFRGEFWFALAASFMLFTGFELASPKVNRITFIRGREKLHRLLL